MDALSHSLQNIALMFGVAVLAVALIVPGVIWFLRKIDRIFFKKIKFDDELAKGNIAVGIVVGAVAAAFILGLFLFASKALAADLNRYDDEFRQWGRVHFGYVYDWEWFKAQGMTESGLKPDVCSHVGACGLMQFMPGTAVAMGLQDRFNARESVRLGIAYDRRLWDQFTSPRPLFDRLAFALMSYNAGLGNVLAFQRQAHVAGANPNLFETIKPWVWREPRDYVERISRWHGRFIGVG